MTSTMLVLLLMGIIGVITIFGGYRFARVERQNSKQIRAIIAIIIAVIMAVWLLYDMGFFDEDNEALPTQTQSTSVPVENATLTLNETASYSLLEGYIMSLSYTGELGQVVTLSVEPEDGDSPPVTIIRGDPPAAERSIRARGLQTIICGYEYTDNETVTFTFQAVATTTYTIEFVDGNTCRG